MIKPCKYAIVHTYSNAVCLLGSRQMCFGFLVALVLWPSASLEFAEPQFLHLQSSDVSTHQRGLLWGLNGKIYVVVLAQCFLILFLLSFLPDLSSEKDTYIHRDVLEVRSVCKECPKIMMKGTKCLAWKAVSLVEGPVPVLKYLRVVTGKGNRDNEVKC